MELPWNYQFDIALLQESQGSVLVGLDEAGRGPIAGPVVVAAVVLQLNEPISGINDSKKLSEKKRNILYDQITEQAIAYTIQEVAFDVVDRINVYQATSKGMRDCLEQMKHPFDTIITDSMPLKGFNQPLHAIVRADQKSATVGAASILAKVHRDRIMKTYHQEYSRYGFIQNKGYPTRSHVQALWEHGPCPIHRKSFNPVKQWLLEHGN